MFAGHLGSICSGGSRHGGWGLGASWVSPFAAHCRVPAETVPKIRSPRGGDGRDVSWLGHLRWPFFNVQFGV